MATTGFPLRVEINEADWKIPMRREKLISYLMYRQPKINNIINKNSGCL